MLTLLRHRRKSFRSNDNLEFTVRTTGSSEVVDLTQMTYSLSSYNATIDWGDGSTNSTATAYNDADLAHTYSTAGDYQISISGTFGTVYTSGTSQLGYGNTLRSQIISVQNVGSLSYTTADYSWQGCTSLTTFNFGNVDYSGISADGLLTYFSGCSSLTSISFGDLDTSSVTSMASMFNGCSSLTSIDLSSFNTSSVTNMTNMFFGCSSLTSIDLSSFDTSSVIGMSSVFRNCSSLTSVDLSSFNTSSVTNMANMFNGCSSLTSIDLSSFDTSSVVTMINMFKGMSSSSQLTITGIEDFDITAVNANRMTSFMASTGGLSTTVYDELLVNWEAQTGYNAQNPNFGSSQYTSGSAAATARADLVTAGWTITDGGTIDFATAGMTLDVTWSTIGTNYSALDNATSASAKVYCNFDKDDTGIIMEAGGSTYGLILYIHNETLYFQCGESGTAGGDSNTGEVSYTVTNTTAQDFIIEWSADTSGCALYVDKTLIGTDVFSNSVISGTDDGTIGQGYSGIPVNRGSSGSFTGTVTKAEIFVGEVTSDVSGL